MVFLYRHFYLVLKIIENTQYRRSLRTFIYASYNQDYLPKNIKGTLQTLEVPSPYFINCFTCVLSLHLHFRDIRNYTQSTHWAGLVGKYVIKSPFTSDNYLRLFHKYFLLPYEDSVGMTHTACSRI